MVVGSASISMQEFESVKMRKFSIRTVESHEEGYFEAFLLKLQ
jgi:hypothetical protein